MTHNIAGLKDSSLLKTQALVGGHWLDANDGRSTPVLDPADGSEIARVPNMGVAETRRAILAAQQALTDWRTRTADERSRVLRRWYDLMIESVDDLALLITREQGKPLAEARAEIAYSAAYIEWYAEEARRINGEVLASPWRDRRIVVTREPVGVCAAITPWNFPSAMLARKAAPALAAGCTMIVKPAPQTPLSALALAVLGERAGLPPGVLSVVTGDALEIGGELTANPVVRKLSFTGSTQVGRVLSAQCAPTLKKLSMELGGNAPVIVFDDADLDVAVEGVLAAKFRNAGQACVAANRILVQAGVFDVFAERLAEAVGKLVVGRGTDPGVAVGPLIDRNALAKVEHLLADARAQGARVLTGGRPHELGGTFFQPTVVAGANTSMRMAHEEIFGPLAPLYRFETEDEAVALANDTEAGLAAYFFSRDLRRCWRVGERLATGMVGVNTGAISTAVAPFGGVKQSGQGREGSSHGIADYLDLKYWCLGAIA
ncbi:NAD-dependent succinate-semialdehyde dehydrogenase [Rhizobacter sp. AJA081-3]|uniref:NAD-dependent succinate-semialdehyde dehydrogenase n=1 Tax=Rhizobacter sp. AJA081-3 TaxID=2753607 RepID=UPI001AE08820|nr:NAD-dependent succinate-semialdehyde dehydrogenase [Rhizobacter sp. AJA081-3]QTN25723.1 NAD-dependent succinate-semialdehyde dehydrogenase [Rhizobacter sp. AJA081-3]